MNGFLRDRSTDRGKQEVRECSKVSLPERLFVPNPPAAEASRGRSIDWLGARDPGATAEAPDPRNPRRFALPHFAIGGIFSGHSRSGVEIGWSQQQGGCDVQDHPPHPGVRRDGGEGPALVRHGARGAVAHPAAVVHRAKAQVSHVVLNGTLMGIPFGTVSQDGIKVSSFVLKGKTPSMGKVVASLGLADTLIAPGKQPNLSNATLTLSNARGSIQLKTAASPSTRYVFIVTSGTGVYASAYGSGTAVISYNRRMHEYQIGLRTSAH